MDKLKQGPDFVHLAVEHILLLLYRTLQDVLGRNPALPAAAGIQIHLLGPEGEGSAAACLHASTRPAGIHAHICTEQALHTTVRA